MSGIKNLQTLLHSMRPQLVEGQFVFCTVSETQFTTLHFSPLLTFREKEGITIICDKKTADQNSLSYEAVWAMITLTVHSDLTAIGFLAAITKKLADNGISLNAVSAYYHDHIFVPYDTSQKSIQLLHDLSLQ